MTPNLGHARMPSDWVSPKIKAPRKGPPDVAEAADNDDEERLGDEGAVHAQGYARGGGHEDPPEAGQQAADDEDTGENPAHVDSYGPDHLPVDRCSPRDLTYARFIHQEPEQDGHDRPHYEEEHVVDGKGKSPKEPRRPLSELPPRGSGCDLRCEERAARDRRPAA